MLAFYKSPPTNNLQTLNNPRGFGPIFKGKIMAHLIETNTITGKSEIAYVAQKPWHGLGQQLTADAPIDVWRKEAGLDWEAQVSPVMFWPEGIAAPQVVENKNVIFRNDTKTPLGVVSDRYKIHQPADVLDFFNTLVQSAGFSLEVAGAIRAASESGLWQMSTKRPWFCMTMQSRVTFYSAHLLMVLPQRLGNSPASGLYATTHFQRLIARKL
jgi:hypothetical protein